MHGKVGFRIVRNKEANEKLRGIFDQRGGLMSRHEFEVFCASGGRRAVDRCPDCCTSTLEAIRKRGWESQAYILDGEEARLFNWNDEAARSLQEQKEWTPALTPAFT